MAGSSFVDDSIHVIMIMIFSLSNSQDSGSEYNGSPVTSQSSTVIQAIH